MISLDNARSLNISSPIPNSGSYSAAMSISAMTDNRVLTLFQLPNHSLLEIVRCASSEQQPLGQCTMIKRPEHVFIIREPVQCQHLVQFRFICPVACLSLPFPHRLVQMLRDLLRRSQPPSFESESKCVGHGINELFVGHFGWNGTCRWCWNGRSRFRSRYGQVLWFVNKGSVYDLICKIFEVQKALNHFFILRLIFDDIGY